MKTKENIVIVDHNGRIKRCATVRDVASGENIAVGLVMVYIPETKQIALFNRGAGAADMHNHWSLQAGKVNGSDLPDGCEKSVGEKLPTDAVRNTASREFIEELNVAVQPSNFEFVQNFHMPQKRIFFTLMALGIRRNDVAKLRPDQSEVDDVQCFTIEQFRENADLGDAIVFRKEAIINFLEEKFRQEACPAGLE